MLNRLKAAWKVLFSEQYVVATLDKDSQEVDTDMACTATMLGTIGLYCIQEAASAIEKRRMNNLVEQAKELVESKEK